MEPRRLDNTLQRLRQRGEKAMGLFVTNGFPDPASTPPVLEALVQGGADFIELGMPFSDPLAEGLPIQRSSERALRHGVRMADAFRTADAFRARHETPLLLMGYLNPVLRYGVRAFCRDAAAAGVDGLILPDLPIEEADLVAAEAAGAGLAMVHLIAPTTPDDRITEIDCRTTGFVYAVSVTGLTGAGLGDTGPVAAYLQRARQCVTHNPLLVGFGIRSHENAQRLSAHTDGFIVGSALIRQVEALWDEAPLPEPARYEALRQFAHALKWGTGVAASP